MDCAKTEKSTKKMVDLYKQGWSLQQIGEHFGISRQAVQQRLQKEGISGSDRHWGRKIENIDKADLQRLYSEGKNLTEIGEYFSTSASTIYAALKFHKIPKREKPGKWVNIFKSMEIGENRVVGCDHVHPYASLNSLAVKKGIRISIKKIGDNLFNFLYRVAKIRKKLPSFERRDALEGSGRKFGLSSERIKCN